MLGRSSWLERSTPRCIVADPTDRSTLIDEIVGSCGSRSTDHGISPIFPLVNSTELQQALFKRIKELLPAHISLSEEIASLLGVSSDSAYRRIRGEKPLDIGELRSLCSHFKLSLDALMGQNNGSHLFTGRFVNDADFPFHTWLSSIIAQLELALEGKDPTFIFQAKDIPLFHHFQVPELAQFKFFFWRKTILQQSGPELEHFDLERREKDLLALGRKAYLTYERLPSIEILNVESMNSTLRQISFYRESGMFAKEEDAQLLFDRVLALLDHIEAQAEAGVKFSMGEKPSDACATYRIYVNEVMLGDNTIYLDNGRVKVVFLNHSVVNYVATTDEGFCANTYHTIENIMKRSTLISGSGEKERKRFFRALREEVERRRK